MDPLGYGANPELGYTPVDTTSGGMTYPGFGEASANDRDNMLKRFRLFQQLFGGQGMDGGGLQQQPSGFAGGLGSGMSSGLGMAANKFF